MIVRTLRSLPFEVNVHVVLAGDEALVVDSSSGLDFERVGSALSSLVDPRKVRFIHLTHWHVDHVRGASSMKRLCPQAVVTMHGGEARAVEEGEAVSTLGSSMGLDQPPCEVRKVEEGEVLEVGGYEFEILLVPGHSPYHTALWEPKSASLFSGDVVFEGGDFGRTDLPGGNPRLLLKSLERLSTLGAKNLYPGHLGSVVGRASEAIEESLESARATLE